jgi:amino acid transporter
MACLYPESGSAYAYVSRGLNPHLGFLAGWLMLMGYLVIPVVNVIYVALTIQRVAPWLPFQALALAIALCMTYLNLRGIEFTARANQVLLASMFVLIGLFFALGVRFVFNAAGWAGLLSAEPFYNPETFRLSSVATATSLAALTFIGFDGVTTLAEETRNPRRTVPAAVVLTCLFTGILSAAELYLAQRVWPDYRSFANPETAFLDVSHRAGGAFLLHGMAGVLAAACFGSGFSGQAAAARLLYGMGRDRVIPLAALVRISPASGAPHLNILFVGALAAAGAFVLNYERSAALLNFGAFLAFMLVNAACIRKCFFSAPTGERQMRHLLIPGAGFMFCLWIWTSLPKAAWIAGGAWLGAGIVWGAVRTRGYRSSSLRIDFGVVEAADRRGAEGGS